jgi:hypothetical protein
MTLESFLADGVEVCVTNVEFPISTAKVVNSVVNSNITRYHDDLEYMNNIRSVLNYTMSNNLGFDASYFRTSHEGVSKTLKTYTIHNVVENAEIKIIMEEDSTPTNETSFDEYMIYYGGVEIWIDKTEWEKNFSEPPTPKDSLYIPFFNRRMTVSKVILERDFGDFGVSYKLNIVKHIEDGSVDTSSVDTLINDFSSYINGAGIYQEVDETKEFIDASNTDSSINDTEVTPDMINHNYHSLLTYREGDISVYENLLTKIGILGAHYFYRSPTTTDEKLLLNYNVSTFDTSRYSLSFWASFGTVEDCKIFKTFKEDNVTHVLSLKKEGNLSFEIFSGGNSITVQTLNQNPILPDVLYHYSINRTQSFVSITVSSYDTETEVLTTLQEYVGANAIADNTIDNVHFMCDSNIITLGMIKMNMTTIPKSEIENHIFKINHHSTIFVDDCKTLNTDSITSPSVNDFGGLSEDTCP